MCARGVQKSVPQKFQRFFIDSKYPNRSFQFAAVLAALERQEGVSHLKPFRFVAALAVIYSSRRF